MTTSGLWCCAGLICKPHGHKNEKGKCKRPKSDDDESAWFGFHFGVDSDETDEVHDLHLHMIVVVTLFAFCVYATWKYRQAVAPVSVQGASYDRVNARDDAYEAIDMSPISSRYQSSTP